MSVAFYYPTQGSPAAQWSPLPAPDFPHGQPTDYPQQLTGETAAGTFYVQDKGAGRQTFDLNFSRLTESERDTALSFFHTVKKAFNTFEYVDPEGNPHTVRWTNAFDFREVASGRYAGTVQLRQE